MVRKRMIDLASDNFFVLGVCRTKIRLTAGREAVRPIKLRLENKTNFQHAYTAGLIVGAKAVGILTSQVRCSFLLEHRSRPLVDGEVDIRPDRLTHSTKLKAAAQRKYFAEMRSWQRPSIAQRRLNVTNPLPILDPVR